MLHRLQQIQKEGYTVDISGILNSAWEMLKPQIGIFILFNLLAILVILAVQLIVPIASIATTPFIVLANCHALRESEQGRDVVFGTFFEVFSMPNFGNSIIAYLIMGLLILGLILGLCFVFGGVAGISILAFGGLENIENLEHNTGAMIVLGLLGIIAFIVFFVAIFYLSAVYSLILPTVFFAQDGTGWWELMEASRKALTRNWGMLVLLQFVTSFVVGICVLFTLGIGIIVAIPYMYVLQYVTFCHIIGFEGGDEGNNDITQHFVV